MGMTKIIIVEDEALFRELMHRTLDNEPDIEVLGEAEDGETAIRLVRELKPDVVLMDIELRGEMDGIEAALTIKNESPEVGIVILSIHGDRRYVTSLPLEDSKGWGYLLKQTVPDLSMVKHTIEGVKAGMLVLDPALMKNLRPKKGSLVARLTPRQRNVLELIAQGYNNTAIAERLYLSKKSVETYINVIYQELGLAGELDIHARVKASLIYLQDLKGNH